MTSEPADVTQLLVEASQGDRGAVDALLLAVTDTLVEPTEVPVVVVLVAMVLVVIMVVESFCADTNNRNTQKQQKKTIIRIINGESLRMHFLLFARINWVSLLFQYSTLL